MIAIQRHVNIMHAGSCHLLFLSSHAITRFAQIDDGLHAQFWPGSDSPQRSVGRHDKNGRQAAENSEHPDHRRRQPSRSPQPKPVKLLTRVIQKTRTNRPKFPLALSPPESATLTDRAKSVKFTSLLFPRPHVRRFPSRPEPRRNSLQLMLPNSRFANGMHFIVLERHESPR